MTLPIVRISTPKSGTGAGTSVQFADGTPLEDVTKIKVNPVTADDLVTAELTVLVTLENLYCHPLLALKTLREAAALHGYELTPIEHLTHTPLKTGVKEYRRATNADD